MSQTIDTEIVQPSADEPTATPQMGLAKVESGAVGRAMTLDELHKNLEFIRQVMKKEMKEGQDYGQIPGAGPKPTLLQPGAQKLLMVFNLTERVKRETLREYPGFHREYEFTVTVYASNGKEWDGVGTCSTLESKYRYRKAQKVCPVCGKESVIEGKAEFGGGFVCWKKKGGCDAKFQANDQRITSQPTGDTENEDPADQWNTVRKMAFKRALVAAAINATNTSELWTQDIEDMNLDGRARGKNATVVPGRVGTSHPASSHPKPQASGQPAKPAAPPPQNKSAVPDKRYATVKTREWLIKRLAPMRDLATEYFRKLANPVVLMPNENLEDLGLQFLPLDLGQTKLLEAAITDFGNGAQVRHAYPPNELKPIDPPKQQVRPAPTSPPTTTTPPTPPVARSPAQAPPPANKRDPEWFFDIICPVPPKGVKKADYIKAPDTIRSLYTRMKEGDTEGAGKRLWGFANHYEAKPWVGSDGQTRQPTNADLVFRDALDAFLEWEEKHGEDTLTDGQLADPQNMPSEDPAPGGPELEEDMDVPF